MDLIELFGTRLKAERVRLGLDQAELAAIGGVKPSSQSRYEAAKNYPDARYLAAFAEAGGDVSFVITGKRSSSINSQLLRALVNHAIAARDENKSRNLQAANLVLALYERLEPLAAEDINVEELVRREVAAFVEVIRAAIPDESPSQSGSVTVQGDGNKVVGRDYVKRGKKK